MKPYLYQLVLDFKGDDLSNFDRVIALEESLIEVLFRDQVDGHDVGGGRMNVFIHTNEPQRCLEDSMRVIYGAERAPSAAAYRCLDQEVYVRVWPKEDLTPFTLR